MDIANLTSSSAVQTKVLVPVTVAYGDGIGPEIMRATLSVLEAAGAAIQPEVIEVGEAVYRRGQTNGIEESAWDSLRRTRVLLKAPITTPQGGGMKSLNVTIRKTLGLYANVRPCVTYHPVLNLGPKGMDVVIIRENEEDLYAGIEHRQTQEVTQCLKLISEPGTRKIVRYAFEYARANGRKRVTCMTKDNIMKLTDGLFHRVFDEIGAEYPEIAKDHSIIDIGMAKVATRPNSWDVIVTPNLYGDIMSDVAAEVAGSVGLAGSANIGNHCAMFEAIHGSAPDIAGKDIANPSGLLLSAVMMLIHIGQGKVAEKIHNAWLRTIEDGVRTADLAEGKPAVGTQQFAQEVIARLGQLPTQLAPVTYPEQTRRVTIVDDIRKAPQHQELVGVDVFVQSTELPDDLAAQVKACEKDGLPLLMITNRGVKVWPNGFPETFCTDHWRCRFQAEKPISRKDVVELLSRMEAAGVEFVKTEQLYTFDGKPGFSLGQGQ
jgi:isocitrate dehydrogenase